MSVTAILLSYKRRANMPHIIAAIRAQSVDVEIWLINNDGLEGFGADRLIAIPWNAGEWARFAFAARAATEYVYLQDDDIMLGDHLLLDDMMRMHRDICPDQILGVAGRGLQREAPHYYPDYTNTDAWADIVKGRVMLFKRSLIDRMRMVTHPSASDVQFSVYAGGPHWISASIYGRMVELPTRGVGYEFRDGHYKERNEVCAQILREKEMALCK